MNPTLKEQGITLEATKGFRIAVRRKIPIKQYTRISETEYLLLKEIAKIDRYDERLLSLEQAGRHLYRVS